MLRTSRRHNLSLSSRVAQLGEELARPSAPTPGTLVTAWKPWPFVSSRAVYRASTDWQTYKTLSLSSIRFLWSWGFGKMWWRAFPDPHHQKGRVPHHSQRPRRNGAGSPWEPICYDDTGITCRWWNWKQGPQTALTDETTRVPFILDDLDPLSGEELLKTAEKLCNTPMAISPAVQTSYRVLGVLAEARLVSLYLEGII